jgi:TRAP-type C4-dicarboxylate transport system permease small subunit
VRRAFSALGRNCEDVLGAVCLVTIGLTVLVQIVSRYLLRDPVKWSDELGRVLLAWLTFLGASAVLRAGGHPRTAVVRDWFGPRGRRMFDRFAMSCWVVLLAYGTYYGFVLVSKLTTIKLVTLNASWAWWYAAFPIGTAFMLMRIVERVARGKGLDD